MPLIHNLSLIFFFTLFLPNYAEGNQSNLSVGVERTFDNFDPRFTVNENNERISELIHCKLFTYDRFGNVKLQLAEQLPTWSSATSFEIMIKKGFKFNNGKPVTLEDVAAIYLSTASNLIYPKSSELMNLKAIQILQNKLVFKLKKPDPFIIHKLNLGIVPKSSITNTALKIERTPTCGPYYVKNQTLGRLSLEMNHFNNFENIKSKTINFEINSKVELIKSLVSGDLDIVLAETNASEVKKIALKNPNLKSLISPKNSIIYLGFNTRNKFFKNRNIRAFISKNIFREKLNSLIFDGNAEVPNQLFIKNNFYYSKVSSNRSELSAYQVPDKITINTNTDKNNIIVAKAIANDLKKVGIKASVQPLEWGELRRSIEADKITMWVYRLSNIRSPDIIEKSFDSSQYPPHGINRSFFKNTEIDNLIDGLMSEVNLSKQEVLVTKIQTILSRERPYFYLLRDLDTALQQKSIVGFTLQYDGSLRTLSRAYKK